MCVKLAMKVKFFFYGEYYINRHCQLIKREEERKKSQKIVINCRKKLQEDEAKTFEFYKKKDRNI